MHREDAGRQCGRVAESVGAMGVFHGALYQREQDGKVVYGTRKLPGSTEVLRYTVATPAASPAHAGLGAPGVPQLGLYPREFKSAARTTGIDEAWLRAIAQRRARTPPMRCRRRARKA